MMLFGRYKSRDWIRTSRDNSVNGNQKQSQDLKNSLSPSFTVVSNKINDSNMCTLQEQLLIIIYSPLKRESKRERAWKPGMNKLKAFFIILRSVYSSMYIWIQESKDLHSNLKSLKIWWVFGTLCLWLILWTQTKANFHFLCHLRSLPPNNLTRCHDIDRNRFHNITEPHIKLMRQTTVCSVPVQTPKIDTLRQRH